MVSIANRVGLLSVGLVLVLLTGCATFNTHDTVKHTLQSVHGSTPNHILLKPFKYYPADDYWCGPSVLASLLDYHQVTFDYQNLVNQLYTPGKKGTYLHDLKAAARSYKLLPFKGPTDLNTLLQMLAEGYPVIVLENSAFSWWPRWHYRLLIGYDSTRKRLFSLEDNGSMASIKMVNFLNAWEKAHNESLLIVPAYQIPTLIEPMEIISEYLAQKELNHLNNADQILQHGMRQHPSHAIIQFTAANNAYDKGHHKQASDLYQIAINSNPDFPEAYINWAYTLHHLGCKEASNKALHCAKSILKSKLNKQKQLLPTILELKKLPLERPSLNCPALTNCD